MNIHLLLYGNKRINKQSVLRQKALCAPQLTYYSSHTRAYTEHCLKCVPFVSIKILDRHIKLAAKLVKEC